MSKMVFRKLHIFSSSERKAKVVEFSEGKNIITSDISDGTDRGKSIIMKSLYHTLGADCYFGDKWDDKSKTYIVHLSVDTNDYYFFRSQSLFKVFDSNRKHIFSCISRHELGEKLLSIFNFAAKLPNRNSDKLEIAPPAYNYILYFLDQDKQDGPLFKSFRHLDQYANFKENLLYYHFGVFDENYYNIIQKIEQVNEAITKLEGDYEITQAVIARIHESLNMIAYSSDIEHLERDIDKTKGKYNEIARMLSSIRSKLIELRNNKEELNRELDLLEKFNRRNETNIDSLREHICPLCRSHLNETLDLKIAHFNTSDDIMLLHSDRLISLNQVERDIDKQEMNYKEWLSKLNEYERSLQFQSREINDVLKHKGLIELRDKTADELNKISSSLEENNNEKKCLNDEKKQYTEKKDMVNKKYYELMLSDKMKFGLEEIEPDSLKKITSTFTADGSNRPIATIVWYINMIKLKNIFAPKAIKFPIVFDSPNNAETDDNKRAKVFKYLCDNVDEDSQLIISGLGFAQKTYDGVVFDRVINLENDKYSLLCEKDYQDNIELFEALSYAQ